MLKFIIEVMFLQWMDFVLVINILDVEFDVFVCDGFDVEVDGGNGGDVLVEFEFVENGGFVGSVEVQYEQVYFFGFEDFVYYF